MGCWVGSRGIGAKAVPSVALVVAFLAVSIFGAPRTAEAESPSAVNTANTAVTANTANTADTANAAGAAHAEPLRVLAAASLTEVVEALAARFPDGEILASFGASSDLARQIKDGAPADVFLSASPEWVDFLREANAVDGEPVLVARNALVCIAPEGSPLARAAKNAASASPRVSDPRTLLARIEAGDEIVAVADAGVPAGDYARKALAKLGLAEAFEPRFVGQKDVRAVLHAVEQGEVAAGFVYATDARIARVETLFVFDPATHPRIEYLAAIVRKTDEPARAGDATGMRSPSGQAGEADPAQRFLVFLKSDAARARLSAAGFVLP
ncbi:MAG: molybdate ABC transporter substrate-binding protein [Deltaproteobacteria bacterium]|nr:molybdate ABC transporter substrate-binding protein [Deltaproteobacteria bacterium]